MPESKSVPSRLNDLFDAIQLAQKAFDLLIDINMNRVDEKEEKTVARYIGESRELLERARR